MKAKKGTIVLALNRELASPSRCICLVTGVDDKSS